MRALLSVKKNIHIVNGLQKVDAHKYYYYVDTVCSTTLLILQMKITEANKPILY
jgi:hypothetical protein